jgi:hypothetical protein
MKRQRPRLNTLCATILCVVGLRQIGLAQEPATILDIQGEATVSYFHDIFDYSRIVSDAGAMTPLRPLKPFQSWTDITDIVSVNGKPAKGVWISRGDPFLGLEPTAVFGAALPRAIADVSRGSMVQQYLEILQPDGTPIGTIMAMGMNGGAPPPGAPSAVAQNNLTVTGGTGAFLGVRGQAGNALEGFRIASISEHPANRRINGGRPKRIIIHLIPMRRPEVIRVVHSTDASLVTPETPATAGETLVLLAVGLGPTRPAVDPGERFPRGPRAVANSPIEVTVNGKPADVLYAIGHSGTAGVYQVSFTVPAGIGAGLVSLHVSAAWIVGPEVRIAIR